MIIIALSGPDAAGAAQHYVDNWRRDGSAVLSPFLSDLGIDHADWRGATDDIVEIFAADTVVAALSDADEEGDLAAAREYGETLHLRLHEDAFYGVDLLRTETALRMEAWRRRERR